MSDERDPQNEAPGAAVPRRVVDARRAALALTDDVGLAEAMLGLEASLFSGSERLEGAGQDVLLGDMRAVFEAPAMRDEAVDRAVGQWFAVAIAVAGRRADALVQPVAQAFWWRGKETPLPDSREISEVMQRFLAQSSSGEAPTSHPRAPSVLGYAAVAAGAILLLGLAMLAGWLIGGA